MKLLVVSDTHGDIFALKKTIISKSDAEVVIHCGDGAQEFESLRPLFKEKHFIGVKGNCDFCCNNSNIETITLNGKKIFVTHGHIYNAKYGIYNLVCAAREAEADLLIFGHTHQPLQDFDDGLHILNPGSLKGAGGTYALVDITQGGIVTRILKTD